MSKRMLVGLFALAAIFSIHPQGGAQEAPAPEMKAFAPGFEPGEFLTEGDFGHVKEALGYLNLAPEDLNYEKKHLDHRFRLGVVDEALDYPLSVPKTAESAAGAFSVRSTPTERAMAATELLDYELDRWTHDALYNDSEEYREIFQRGEDLYFRKERFQGDKESPGYKKLVEELDELDAKIFEMEDASIFGESPIALVEDFSLDEYGRSSCPIKPIAASSAMTREGWYLSKQEARTLGYEVAGLVQAPESHLPGSEEGEIDDLFELGSRAHLKGIFVAGARVAWLLSDLAGRYEHASVFRPEWAAGTPDHDIDGVTGNVVAAWESKWGKVVIGGSGPNVYEGDDFIGIIDLGGDDVYRGRVACGIGLPGHPPISFVLDLGGNDRYEGGDFTQGFGFLGVGILMDVGEGDDHYSARFCAQGAGMCGYGLLHDDGGNDTFTADSFAQGAGMFGYGQLINEGGDDVYRGCRYTQGFAQVMGVGVLTDGGGNDMYYAGGKYLHQPLFSDRYQSLSQGFAIGNRRGGETGGGVALLLDEGDGNDVYHADIYGQGSSYWYSLGMLVDHGGNDTYTLGQYGQGAGIHLSAGILVDIRGNDTYTNTHGVGTGGAHDWSVGWLIDRDGNDLYQGNGQGQGLNFSIGILLDCAGDDSHSSRGEGNIGKGVNNDISLLLDLAGKDSYTPKEVKDGQFTPRGRHAMVYDVPEGWFPGIDVSTLPTRQDPPPAEADVQHILISWKGKNDRVTPKDPDRTEEEAKELLFEVLKQARTKGADWEQLQKDHNEDSMPHETYTAKARSGLVKPFNDLALSLGVGQIDWCESTFGYHIIKRVE